MVILEVSHAHVVQGLLQVPRVAGSAVQDKQHLVGKVVLGAAPRHCAAEVQEPLLGEARVTQAFLCEHHTTGRLDLEEPLRKHGFSEGYPSRAFSLKSPAALPPSSRVRRSPAPLPQGPTHLPQENERPLGRRLQKNLGLSMLNTSQGV